MNSPLELVVASFTGEKRAGEVLKKLPSPGRDQGFKLVNVAVLSKNLQGKFKIYETEDINPQQGAVFGAIAGGLLGLLAGPAGAVIGAAAGAAVGGVAANRFDMGFENEMLQSFESALPAGNSALIALVEESYADPLHQELLKFSDDIFRQALTSETSNQIWDRLGKSSSQSGDEGTAQE